MGNDPRFLSRVAESVDNFFSLKPSSGPANGVPGLGEPVQFSLHRVEDV